MKIDTIEETLKEHAPYLFRYAMMLAHQEDLAKELVQISFIKLWQKQEQIQEGDALRSWLRTVCLNEYRMAMRKKTQRAEEELDAIEELESLGDQVREENITVLDELQAEEDVHAIRNGCFHAMAQKLTLPQRMAFSLVDMFGLSIEETALLLQLSQPAVKGLLFRARRNLESFFDDHCPYIKENATCRCSHWIDFLAHRDQHQRQVKLAFDALEYETLGYQEQQEVHQRLLYYYQHMPSIVPDEAWYQTMTALLKTS